LGEISPLEGWIKYGDSVKIGYFAQGHEQLSQQHRVIDEISSCQPEMPADQARTFLANYLFKGDDVFKRVSDLSGGERGRLALALLSLEGANFLLLDEPTNHLDIPSQEILQSVLEQFEGTILLVSHDRYLVARLATQIWDIEDGRLRIFEGNYNDYLIAKAVEADESEAENALADEDMNWVEEIAPIPVGKKAQRAQNKRLEKIENRMVEYELLSAQIRDEILAAVSEDQLAVLRDEYKVVQAELVSMNEEWEQLNS
jgi:ATP-binding cassette subfamily F protein 3